MRSISATRRTRTRGRREAAAAAPRRGTLTKEEQIEGRQGAVPGHLLGVPPGRRARGSRTCSRRSPGRTSCWRTRSGRSASCSTASPDRSTVNGKRLRLGHAADEPAQRRRGGEHPDLRAQRWGNSGEAVTAAEVARSAQHAAAGRAPRTDADLVAVARAGLALAAERWHGAVGGGTYRPPSARCRGAPRRRRGVPARRAPVTARRVPAFVREHPAWQRDRVPPCSPTRLLARWTPRSPRRTPCPARRRRVVVRRASVLRRSVEAAADRGRVGVRGRGVRHRRRRHRRPRVACADPRLVRRRPRRRLPESAATVERLGRARPARRSYGSGSRTSTACSSSGDAREAGEAERDVLRRRSAVGGADADDYASFMRVAFRSSLAGRLYDGEPRLPCALGMRSRRDSPARRPWCS